MNSSTRRTPRTMILRLIFGLGLLAGSAYGARLWWRARPVVPQGPPGTAAVPGPTVATPGPARWPEVWVVAVGIDQYQDKSIPACHGATLAARAVGDWFTSPAGWDESHVLRLDDRGGGPDEAKRRLPTRANLDWACKDWLAHRVRPDDVVVFFFAGQGVSPPGGRGPSYLLPIDARADDSARTSWRLEEAIDLIAASGRNPVVCWLDTSAAGRGKTVTGGDGAAPAGPMLQKLVRWPGVTAWIAADGRPAPEPKFVGELGPFTTALIQALGTPERPNNLLGGLNLMSREPGLTARGFRSLGGIDPGLSLWSTQARRASLLKRELVLQRGHADRVAALTLSADGARLVSGSEDSTIKIWDAAERKVLRALDYHAVGVTGLALSPDGRLLASGDGDGWVRLWDFVRHDQVPAGSPRGKRIEQVAFLPDGARFVALDGNGQCWLWETANPSGQPRQVGDHVSGLAVAPRAGPIGFALATTDGKLLLHGADGAQRETLDGPGGFVASRSLATDGRRLAAGDDRGRVVVRDAERGADLYRHSYDDPIQGLILSPSGPLAVASKAGLHVTRFKDGVTEPGVTLPLPDPAERLDFSQDGRWLAASTASGRLLLWGVGEEEPPRSVPLAKESEGRTTAFAFAPDGLALVSGDKDGGLRTWTLPRGEQGPRVPPRRGQIAALSVSDDGRRLLQVTQDYQAQVWDLQEGRGLQRFEGEWTSGVITADGNRLFLAGKGGDLACLDRATGQDLGVRYERPEARNGPGKATQRFERLARSEDGRWVAAGSKDGPLVCVWEAASGRLVQTIRGHEDPHPITAVGFSADAGRLLTASEDGTAKVWDLGDHAGEARAVASYASTDEVTGDPLPITAATMTRGSPRRVVTGAIDGRLLLWDEGKTRPTDLGTLGRAVLAAAFTPDGRRLAVAGLDKSVWLYEMSRLRRLPRLEPNPQHAEQVNALVAWPGGKLIASGSNDTTVRLWGLEEKSLLGTLSAEQGTTDWVAYTPDGLFDGSLGGEKQVTWLVDREVLSLEQVFKGFHLFRLTDRLRRGERPWAPEPPREPPPRLSVAPSSRPRDGQRVVELTIASSETGLENLRLYQNGIPVLGESDLAPGAEPGHFAAEVHLRPGVNRFHVMAGRAGLAGLEGRSPVVEVRYDGTETPGRLHVLALGVSRYKDPDRALQFADRDAQQIAQVLHERGRDRSGEPGLQIVLANDEISEDRVDAAFLRLRDAVKGRPEDTVVVFLAGHADILNDYFYLLLPTFPFQKAVDPRTGRPRLAAIPAGAALPYANLYYNLSRLNVLQRLVVIDACQAAAVEDDPGVQRIQELIDTGAHRSRTAYLLSARRGEPAGEAAALEHGLMTYALLRGMAATSLEKLDGLTMLDDVPNADRNRDGVITTEELGWYADWSVPRLARGFPQLVQRLGAGAPLRPSANLNQKPRVQGSDASFPLVELPRQGRQGTKSQEH